MAVCVCVCKHSNTEVIISMKQANLREQAEDGNGYD